MWMCKFKSMTMACALLLFAAMPVLGCGAAPPEQRDAVDKVQQKQQELMQDPGYRRMIEEEQRRQQEMRE